MRITELELACRDPDSQRRFYVGGLGLPLLDSTATSFTVQVGHTRLNFQQRPEMQGAYHFAFNIPENQLAAAKHWIQERATLLQEDGNDEFSANPDWNAQMFYFCDADGNVLECIARHRLTNTSDQAFGPESLLSVSEIGYAVEDVAQSAAGLQQQLGLDVFGTASNAFTPLGDDEGLLIVVKLGRAWFPTRQAAQRLPVTLTLQTRSSSSAQRIDLF
ncbi:hypothetical protein EHF33_09135 [Deinococcus psychrotolerans]|uniref:VOC domain-containing protein n=1 Tax=Deinococcus psychrotolerans TaxID=2489213 RepID=A0A3G8YDA4_9DEIO|nr:VOC family protein [Deinococcus psychrotolerans]AZI42893.1 hypothetical protein EHF33_09135 [Deinococcus psychrotolerans]